MARMLSLYPISIPRALRRLVTVAALCISVALFVAPFRTRQQLLDIPDSLQPSLFLNDTFRRSRHGSRAYSDQHPFRLEEHLYLDNGLLEVNPKARHPIYDLIKGSEREWEHKMRKQSRTLKQAVAEYRRRYARPPPTGFDKWWAYAKRHRVQLPDEYDQIMNDVERFWAHRPADLRQLQNQTRSHPGSWSFASNSSLGQIVMSTSNVTNKDMQAAKSRMTAQLDLMNGFGEEWKDDRGKWTNVGREIVKETGNWEMTFTIEDGPVQLSDWDLNDKKLHAAEYGEYIDAFAKPESNRLGWAAACPPYSPLREEYPHPPKLPLADPSPKTFVYDHHKLMDPCNHPDLVPIHGYFLSHAKSNDQQGEQKLIFSTAKTMLHGDVLVPSVQEWVDDIGTDFDWAKKDGRLAWRGGSDDIDHSASMAWNASQRTRLVTNLNEEHRKRPVLLPPRSNIKAVGDPIDRDSSRLNSIFTDVSFTGEPTKCKGAECETLQNMFAWKEEERDDALNKYRFVLDVDGRTSSTAFKRLITSTSLLFKATVFPEWYTDRIMPWVHYVPVKMDYSDIYDIMTFFRGDVRSLGEDAHEDLAEKIALAGSEWSRSFYRKEDMVAYMWRLLLEYGRLMNDRRDEMNFVI